MDNLKVVTIEHELFELFKEREKILFISRKIPIVPWIRGLSFILKSDSALPEEMEVLLSNVTILKPIELTIGHAKEAGYSTISELHKKLCSPDMSVYEYLFLSYIKPASGGLDEK